VIGGATIMRFMGRRSIGGYLLFLAVPMALPIPAPGLSVLFAVPVILVSAQRLLGRRRGGSRRSSGPGLVTAAVVLAVVGLASHGIVNCLHGYFG
jgi:hypothetical protein